MSLFSEISKMLSTSFVDNLDVKELSNEVINSQVGIDYLSKHPQKFSEIFGRMDTSFIKENISKIKNLPFYLNKECIDRCIQEDIHLYNRYFIYSMICEFGLDFWSNLIRLDNKPIQNIEFILYFYFQGVIPSELDPELLKKVKNERLMSVLQIVLGQIPNTNFSFLNRFKKLIQGEFDKESKFVLYFYFRFEDGFKLKDKFENNFKTIDKRFEKINKNPEVIQKMSEDVLAAYTLYLIKNNIPIDDIKHLLDKDLI